MKINVTAEHIQKGRRKSAAACPIYKALRSAKFPVRGVLSRYVQDSSGFCFELPRRAKQFINRFDQGKKVKPFAFILR